MAEHKNTPSTDQQTQLEAGVDAMMDPQSTASNTTEPLDIFAGTTAPISEVTTAPTLPGKSIKATPQQPEIASAQPEVSEVPADEPEADVKTDSQDIVIEPLSIDTPQTDAAIDDIVAQEADQVLAAQDAGITAAQARADEYDPPQKSTGHPVFWFIVFMLVLLAGISFYVLTSPGLELPFVD